MRKNRTIIANRKAIKSLDAIMIYGCAEAAVSHSLALGFVRIRQSMPIVTEQAFEDSETRMSLLRDAGRAVSVRYDRHTARVVVMLNTGVQLAFPAKLAEGLAGAPAESLAEIEISPAGLSLHWPRLDADVYIPALLQGVFGSKNWMARQLGTNGGRSRTNAKVAAARENGRKGGRPRKKAAAE